MDVKLNIEVSPNVLAKVMRCVSGSDPCSIIVTQEERIGINKQANEQIAALQSAQKKEQKDAQ